MSRGGQLREFAELLGELSPGARRRIARTAAAAREAQRDLGALGELEHKLRELERPTMVEVAPGVFQPGRRSAVGTLRELLAFARERRR